jgi:hypothetical protein
MYRQTTSLSVYAYCRNQVVTWVVQMYVKIGYVSKLLGPSLVALAAAGVALVDQVPSSCTAADKDLTGSQSLGISIRPSLDQIG